MHHLGIFMTSQLLENPTDSFPSFTVFLPSNAKSCVLGKKYWKLPHVIQQLNGILGNGTDDCPNEDLK